MIQIASQSTPGSNAAFKAVESRFEAVFSDTPENADAIISNSTAGAVAALTDGKHVLFDAPEALGIADCRALSEAASTSGVVVMPAHAWRFVPSVATVQASVASGKLGDPGLLRVHRWKAEAGDDCIRRMAFADLDLAAWIFGGCPQTLYVIRREGYVQWHLGFVGDGMALIDHATARSSGMDYESLTMIGSRGTAYADDHHNMNLLFANDHANAVRTSQASVHLVDMLKEFFGAIEQKREPAVRLADAEKVLKVMDSVVDVSSPGSAQFQLVEGTYEAR